VAIEVREARPDEHEEVGRTTARAYREFVRPGSGWDDYIARIADVAGRARRTRILVAVEAGRILGSLTLELEGRVRHDEEPPADDEAHVRMLGVDPTARRRGVARRLMLAAEEMAVAAGRRRLTLNTVERMRSARVMYESLGYRRMPDRALDDGSVLISYEKRLGPPARPRRT
jgi:ribosomal protein S18 acetylase RimI-like enzyme